MILATRFVPLNVDSKNPDHVESLWQWTDETVIPAEQRRMLLENGIRVGRVTESGRFESKLTELSQPTSTDEVTEFLVKADVASENPAGKDRIPLRMGKRYEFPVRLPVEGALTPLVRYDDQVIGRSLDEPQFLFAMTANRGKSSREIELQLVPEIQHGAMRQRWTSSDSALRIDTRRDAWTLDPLHFSLTGGENDVFVIGETLPRRGLGRLMLSGEDAGRVEQQMVLVLSFQDIPSPVDNL
ncbi:hypothetical protein Pla52n_11250 [Stieleria varia]|uniref:Uncharacterized protein n=2 Tax=Stieleria varia TaxID=2528005 RepID=A0A5C6BA76_9BACT|nr:hypothetical protein Pla52n_11250 [Stieleria varia]